MEVIVKGLTKESGHDIRAARNWLIAFLAGAAFCSFGKPLLAEDSPKKERSIDVRDNFKDPVKILGPVMLLFENVNPLRYKVTLARDSEEFDGPDFSQVGLVPRLTPTGETGEAAAQAAEIETASAIARASEVASAAMSTRRVRTEGQSPPAVSEAEEAFEESAAEFQDLSGKADVALSSAKSSVKVKGDLMQAIRDLVEQSDAYLGTSNGLEDLIATAHYLAAQATIALDRKVPSSASLLVEIASGLRTLTNIPFHVSRFDEWWDKPDNRERFRKLEEGFEALARKLEPLGKDGELRKATDGLDAGLKTWRTVLQHLRTDSFQIRRAQRCDFPFFNRREYSFTLTKVDRLESDATKAISSMPVAKIVCLPVLVPSAGISVGGVDERRFAFVPSVNDSGGVKSTIGIVNESSDDILALALINASVGSLGNFQRSYGIYISAGTQINLGDSLEGDRLGYVLGASLSVGRSFFLTVGIEGRRILELTGGFSVGDDVPEGLSEPPTTKEWAFDRFLGITIALR